MQVDQLREQLHMGALNARMMELYGSASRQVPRYEQALVRFEDLFGKGLEVELFSAPGRTEIGGNHTDHQHGRVLAASVDLDMIAVCAVRQERVIRMQSEGYPMDTVDLNDLHPRDAERNQTAALIRGVAARLAALGYQIGGFHAYITSNVLKGSGLSSSAAFEVLMGTILNHLYNDGAIGAVELAQIGQYAENHYFGKPCGLMDQMASAVGGFVSIDFCDPSYPIVEQIPFDFSASGYVLCIVDTGGNHADLTPDYAAVPAEMGAVARLCGAEVLRAVEQQTFTAELPRLRKEVGDRAVLRAMHFFADDQRAASEARALSKGDFRRFLELVVESGRSSATCLQNVFSTQNPREQGISLAMALAEQVLAGRGAWRVHGGGFAGTLQAFVPQELLQHYRTTMEQVFGAGKCHVLNIRPVGGVHVNQ